MELTDHHTGETPHSREPHPRFSRDGRLAAYPTGLHATHIRCSCDECSTHLMGVSRPEGRVEGTCPVCLSQQVTPVTEPVLPPAA
jgi:hypothetical protein